MGDRRRAAAAAILLVLSFVAGSPLLTSGWFNSHETTDPVVRVIAYADEIRHGQVYPRWLSGSYYGKGSPFPIFYSPAFYIAGGYLHLLGLDSVAAMKVECVALFFTGALGMCLWTEKHLGKKGALGSALLYLFAPYHFVDIYVRGAMAEFAALAFLPFLFHGLDLSLTRDRRKAGVGITALSSAAIVLCHQLSAFMISPFAAGYFAWAAKEGSAGWRRVLAGLSGAVIGAGLSAFYWLPVIAEKQWLKDLKAALTSDYFSYSLHFVAPSQWFSPFWGFGTSNPGSRDGMSFQIGTVISLFVLLSIASLPFQGARVRRFGIAVLALGAAALLMTVSFSAPLYAVFAGLEYIQFPWRFLGPATLFLAAAGGIVVSLADERIPGVAAHLPIVAAAALCIGFSQHQRTVSERIPIPDVAAFESSVLLRQEIGPLTRNDEYLPVWASEREDFITMTSPNRPFPIGAVVDDVSRGPSRMSFSLAAGGASAPVTVPWYYFPGWRVRIDGMDVPCGADKNGFIFFTSPPGSHRVTVRFDGTTWDRVTGWAVSAFALVWLVLSTRGGKSSRKLTNFPS